MSPLLLFSSFRVSLLDQHILLILLNVVQALFLNCSSFTRYRHGYWKSIFSLPQYEKLFSPAEFTTYHRNLSTTSEKVINRVLSKSFITAQEKNVQDEIVENVSKVVDEGDGKVWIDEKAGTFGELVDDLEKGSSTDILFLIL